MRGDESALRARLARKEAQLAKLLGRQKPRYGACYDTALRDLRCDIEALKRRLAGEPLRKMSYRSKDEQRQPWRTVCRPRPLPRW